MYFISYSSDQIIFDLFYNLAVFLNHFIMMAPDIIDITVLACLLQQSCLFRQIICTDHLGCALKCVDEDRIIRIIFFFKRCYDIISVLSLIIPERL